jgi:hypothetical protein
MLRHALHKSRSHRRSVWAIALLASLAAAALCAAVARADAPDPKYGADTPQLHVISSVPGTVAGTTKVTVAAGWAWPTHNKDCNLDRAGVGFAVDWSEKGDANEGETADPLADVGYHVTRLKGPNGHANPYPGPRDADDQDVDVGSTGSNGLNPQDNVVHPTPTMNTAGKVQTGNEVDVALPSQFALWRGGCGTYTWLDHFDKNELDPEGIAGPRAHVLNANGVDTGPQDGISHVYYNSVLAKGIKICAIYYDVHGTNVGVTDGSRGGIPNGAQNITAGGNNNNNDNGAEANSGTPLGNSCLSGIPTAVTLKGFAARSTSRGVVLSWRTAAESTLLGFNVYRENANGKRIKLNSRTILGVFGGTLSGHAYSFVDHKAPNAAHLRYWLQTVGLDGLKTWQRVAVANSAS